MFFTLGIETPKDKNTAYGIVVPALCNDKYDCFSAADNESNIPIMATEAILLVVEDMIASGYNIKDIHNDHISYQNDTNYAHYDTWVIINVDLSKFEGKSKRINISLPDILIDRIDSAVKSSPIYKDRSNFLAQAAAHELSSCK
ncbi:type II toxin-antitoxin system HicB family antitoxin [Orbaceae bacterium ESL0727]|nr:type II toxin-antitoxin system HicB family antitoxin [Orbaceae bacterium ESL0727]